ncbi:tape measure protein, partial [Salmonella enterica]|nr:tape measure protein [Salmonella enterica]
MLSARLQAGSNATAAQRREIGELAGKLYDLKSAQDQASRSSSGLKTGLTAIASAITISQLVRYGKQFLEVADAMTQLQARIDRLSPSAEEGRKTFSALAEMASVSGTSLADTEKLWETLTSSLQSAGASNSQVLQLTDTLQKIGKIGGSSTQEMANALRQFGQSIASGTVRAQEFNSIVEQMPELARQIAAGMGISMDELRKLMLDGKLSAEDSLNAIMKQAGKVNDQFTKLPRSVEQATNTLSISFQTLVSEINDTTDASTTMVSVIDSITTAIEKLSGKVPTATQQIADLRSEAEMYARRARTWGWLGFGDWQKENEGRSAKLTAEAWEKSSRAGWDAAQNVAKNSKPIKIKTTTESTEKNGSNKAKNKSSADAAAEAISRQKAALDRLNTG